MEELINRARNGDKDAFVEAISLIQKDLFDFAYMKLNNIDDTNDVIQETLIKAYRNIKGLKDTRYFKTWIIRILINECNKFYKEKYKRINLFDKIKNTGINDIDWKISDIDDKIDNRIYYDMIIKDLKPKEQNLIILYFGNHYTKKEIANILNVSVNTVKTRLRRIEEKIRNSRKGDKNE